MSAIHYPWPKIGKKINAIEYSGGTGDGPHDLWRALDFLSVTGVHCLQVSHWWDFWATIRPLCPEPTFGLSCDEGL